MKQLNNMDIEILSPAGSFECLVAAIKSGADAIYLGGSKFGARAFANNFEEDELLRAIDFAHLHHKKIYLTINTLIKESELTSDLYHYLLPYYKQGLDGVIVQDFGVLSYIRKYFPDLPIHASTQMTVSSMLGAKFLEQEGVERVVPARELSLEEVRAISEKTNLEIECFVHGALCYCFSGQCLYSSMIGGRSGNRGQCAQPCRLPYKVNGKTDYFMSLKDICTLEYLPDLIEAGICSFKIEGRMKKPEYVASVTKMYRKYVDLYFNKGRENYKVNPKDMDDLRDIFNRGDFHSGYYFQHNGNDMITPNKPSHTGVSAITIQNQQGRTLKGRTLKELHKGDIIEIADNGDNYTLGQDYAVNAPIELNIRKGLQVKSGSVLYRTRNNQLIQEIHQNLEANLLKEPVSGELQLYVGCPAQYTLCHGDTSVTVIGDNVEFAMNAPISQDKVRKQLSKMGNTMFQLQELLIDMDDHIFVPMQQLNELRRMAVEQLEEAIVTNFKRNHEMEIYRNRLCKLNDEPCEMKYSVYVEQMEQLEVVLTYPNIHYIYVDVNIASQIWKNEELKKLILKASANSQKIYLAMPHVFRLDTIEKFQNHYQLLLNMNFDGIMVRNLGSYKFLVDNQYDGEIIMDHHMYQFNNESITFWKNHNVSRLTVPLELNAHEMKVLDTCDLELNIYGYTPTMVSAQCITKTTSGCKKKSGYLTLEDRVHKKSVVKNCCDYCYNVIYNNCPTFLLDEWQEIQEINPSVLRMSFTIETQKEMKDILDLLPALSDGTIIEDRKLEYTKGHFRRGVR